MVNGPGIEHQLTASQSIIEPSRQANTITAFPIACDDRRATNSTEQSHISHSTLSAACKKSVKRFPPSLREALDRWDELPADVQQMIEALIKAALERGRS